MASPWGSSLTAGHHAVDVTCASQPESVTLSDALFLGACGPAAARHHQGTPGLVPGHPPPRLAFPWQDLQLACGACGRLELLVCSWKQCAWSQACLGPFYCTDVIYLLGCKMMEAE